MSQTIPFTSNALRRASTGVRLAPLAAVAFAAAVASWMSPPATATAQVAKAWTYDMPISPYLNWRGSRVLAMGDLRAAVEDERNPISPYGIGTNPAGFLTVRDTSWVEQTSTYEDFADRYYGKRHSAVSRASGLRFGWQRSGKWVVGGSMGYGIVDASRHDLGSLEDRSRFIRDFDISLPNYFIPRSGDRTLGAGVETPSASLSYARRFRSWLTLGGRFAYQSESEDRRVLFDEYDFDNRSTSSELAGGALLHPRWFGEKVQLGVYGARVGAKIKGISSSSFNEDEYDWSRPLIQWGAHVFVRQGPFRGLFGGAHQSFDGEQIARVNWAPQFFLNPFPSTVDRDFIFKKRWTTAIAGLRRNEGLGQWMVDVPGTPMHVGMRYAYYREYQWTYPIEGVLSPMLPLDVRRLGYRGAGGLSFDLADGAGTVAMELQMAREHRADWAEERGATAPRSDVPDVSMGDVSYHFGAEYKARPHLPLRAGVVLRRYDFDRRDGQPPYRGIRLSAGAAYRWDAVGLLFDGAWSHEHFHHAPLDPSEEIGEGNKLQLSVQHLF
jgi:hypothetical protein